MRGSRRFTPRHLALLLTLLLLAACGPSDPPSEPVALPTVTGLRLPPTTAPVGGDVQSESIELPATSGEGYPAPATAEIPPTPTLTPLPEGYPTPEPTPNPYPDQ